MFLYILRRLIFAIPTLLLVAVAVFTLLRSIPGDPALLMLGDSASDTELTELRRHLGLDLILPLQFGKWLIQVLSGDLGYSITNGEPVLALIVERFQVTFVIVVTAVSLAICISIPAGLIATWKQNKGLDIAIVVIATLLLSVPAFWLGLLLQMLFAGRLTWFPATGQFDIELKYDNPITRVTGFPLFDSIITGNYHAAFNGLHHMILPALTLSAYSFGLLSRMARANLLEVMSQDYVKVARAYGLSERLIFFKLALRNALPPIVTVTGLSVAYLITGTFFVEQVYNWPGIGSFAVNSLLSIDYPAIMGITLVAAIGYLVTNFIVDLIQSKLDPRVWMK